MAIRCKITLLCLVGAGLAFAQAPVRFEPANAPMETITIEHAERPDPD